MHSRPVVRLLLAAALALPLGAAERNAWPLRVVTVDEKTDTVTGVQALGPLLAEQRAADGSALQAIRPLWLRRTRADGAQETHFLYPFFSWKRDGAHTSFTFFQLINHRRDPAPGAEAGAEVRAFDIWPVYFSRETGEPDTDYRAIFPLAGTIRHRFGRDELSWHLFPLHLRTVGHDGRETRHTPWPFVRVTGGNGHEGFALWPFFGHVARAGDYRSSFHLWPLIYREERGLGDGGEPHVREGFLPFHTRESGPGYRSENYLWPFFGYTERTAPRAYHETRYLWPFLVQGRGEDRHVNRWAPLYTHSIIKGEDKRTVLWALYRGAAWESDGLAHSRRQVLHFLYWTHEQRSLAHPAAAPARKTHLWPFVSAWDNGAGRRQVQVLSPLEVFFPHNDPIRQLYTPLFALYRHDQRAPGDTRWSLLWGAMSGERTATRREFHLGPLFGTRRGPEGARVTFGSGLLCWRRDAGEGRWRFSLLDFRRPSPSAVPDGLPPT